MGFRSVNGPSGTGWIGSQRISRKRGHRLSEEDMRHLKVRKSRHAQAFFAALTRPGEPAR